MRALSRLGRRDRKRRSKNFENVNSRVLTAPKSPLYEKRDSACARMCTWVSRLARDKSYAGGFLYRLTILQSYAPAVKRCPCVYMKKSQDSSDGIKGNFVGIAPCTAPCHQYQLEAFVTFRCRRSIQAKNLHCDVRFPRDMPYAWMSLGTLYAA